MKRILKGLPASPAAYKGGAYSLSVLITLLFASDMLTTDLQVPRRSLHARGAGVQKRYQSGRWKSAHHPLVS